MLGYIRLEILRLVRNGGYLMMSLIMPVGLYVTLAGGGPDQESLVRAMVGAAAFGALGVVITNGTGIAEDRALGWLRQLRLTRSRRSRWSSPAARSPPASASCRSWSSA